MHQQSFVRLHDLHCRSLHSEASLAEGSFDDCVAFLLVRRLLVGYLIFSTALHVVFVGERGEQNDALGDVPKVLVQFDELVFVLEFRSLRLLD